MYVKYRFMESQKQLQIAWMHALLQYVFVLVFLPGERIADRFSDHV